MSDPLDAMRWPTFLSLAICASLASGEALAEKRVALVIGNAAYRDVSPLDNTTNDANLMADTLQGLGFTLIGSKAQLDLDKRGFDKAVQSFGAQLPGADVALFYYAGHGVQVRGANFLVPIDANPKREADVDFQLVDVELVLNQMRGSGTRLNMIILDACRNNPFGGRGLRAAGGGLAQMQAPEGTLISYATQPGNVAQDGADGHSPFTKSLAQTIRRPGLGLFDTFNEVGLGVEHETGGAQQPWVSSSPIAGSFYFAGSEHPEPASAPAATPIVPALIPQPASRSPGDTGFLFPDSDQRQLTRDELLPLTPDQLRIARNEILARKGRYFRDSELSSYFSQFAWYQPNSWDVPVSSIEQANIDLIQSLERSRTADGFIFADSDRRYLGRDELEKLSRDELRIARNEILARKGRYFQDAQLKAHFSQFPWYKPYTWNPSMSAVEEANIALIQSLENR